MNISSSRKERYLSVQETALHVLHTLNEPMAILHSANVITSKVEITLDILKEAAECICQQHVLLQSQIVEDTNGDFRFEPLAGSNAFWPPVQIAEIGVVEDWKDYIPGLTKAGFPKGQPLWRFTCLQVKCRRKNTYSYVFLLSAHHAILDAKGMFDLVSCQLIPIINKLTKEPNFQKPQKPPPPELAKSCDALFMDIEQPLSKLEVKWYLSGLLRTVCWCHDKFGKKIEESKLTLSVNRKYEDVERSHIFPFKLTKAFTKAVLDFCKSNEVTVNSILLSVLGIAIKELQQGKDKKSKKLNLFCSVDLRRFHDDLHTSPLPLGCFVTSANACLSSKRLLDRNNVVKNAKKLQKKVHKQIRPDSLAPNFVKAFSKILLTEYSLTEVLHSLGRVDAVYLSNIGKYEQPKDSCEDDMVKLTEHYFLSDNISMNMFMTCATFDGHMFFTLCGNQHFLDIHYLTEIGHKITKILERSII